MVLRDPDEYPDWLERPTEAVADASVLSKRESECLQLRYEGYSDEEIAEELGIETGTVSTYVRRASRKGDKARNTLLALMEADAWAPNEMLEYKIEKFKEEDREVTYLNPE